MGPWKFEANNLGPDLRKCEKVRLRSTCTQDIEVVPLIHRIVFIGHGLAIAVSSEEKRHPNSRELDPFELRIVI
jgi:hypothetical protein